MKPVIPFTYSSRPTPDTAPAQNRSSIDSVLYSKPALYLPRSLLAIFSPLQTSTSCLPCYSFYCRAFLDRIAVVTLSVLNWNLKTMAIFIRPPFSEIVLASHWLTSFRWGIFIYQIKGPIYLWIFYCFKVFFFFNFYFINNEMFQWIIYIFCCI